MFAYLHTFGGREAALVYPRASEAQRAISGTFIAGEHPGRLVYLDLFEGGTPDFAAFRLALPALLGIRGAACGSALDRYLKATMFAAEMQRELRSLLDRPIR